MSGSVLGRGTGSHIVRQSGNKVFRSAPRSQALAGASRRVQEWTADFITMGLEELVFGTINVPPMSDDGRVEVPDDAPVFKRGRSNTRIPIKIVNKSDVWQQPDVTVYLFDIDSGIVEKKPPKLALSLAPRGSMEVKVNLGTLKHKGRKVLCVEQDGFDRRVSQIIYVT
ncbi:hypothetical protein EOI86_06695 [Hwanghaeella grinnelliae]|uniref:Uncharacterized protein n=1 Tax=Hwanghaeella grinnelliae TaxID=2500179 RepID=A0A3S2ZA15_9PROT|nr:hypothetical protein [Hwanghaeella grinnelliae]RVU38947.1 hypothetical protein EOI86_06695 [Hwanghaeella grinnelliae]